LKKAPKKVCNDCRKNLPLDQYFKANNKDGKRGDCKACFKKRHDSDGQRLRRNLWSKYGLSLNEYYTLLHAQKEKCKICDNKTKLLVDHCHVTGSVRGLICHACNTGIGMLKDNVEIVAEALRYLLKSKNGV
jgi:hypothetical protein